MGSKAKQGAKGLAKAKAKASIAKGQGWCPCQGKVQGQGSIIFKVYNGAGHQGGKGWDIIQEGQPMGQLGAQTVKVHLNRLVAQDPVKNKKLLDHYESLKGVRCQAELCPPAHGGQGWQLHDCH